MALNKQRIGLAAAAATLLAGSTAMAGMYLSKHGLRPAKATVKNGTAPDGKPARILKSGGGYQSVTYIQKEKRFDLALEYYRTFDSIFELKPDITSVLALGAGGCAWPKHVAFERPNVRVDAVEADPEVAKLARRHFFIDELPEESQFTLHECDALDFLLKAQDQGLRFGAIVNDCYSGKDFDGCTLSEETLRLSKACMEPDGIYAVNVVSARGGKSLKNVKRATKALNAAFEHVYVFPSPDYEFGREDNYVLFATDGTYQIGLDGQD